MSLDPSPLSPTPTPLLSPIDPVPSRGSALLGAGISLVLAIIVGVVALRFSVPLLFLSQGLKAHSQAIQASAPYRVMGFDYYWLKTFTPAGSDDGYQSSHVPAMLQDEQQNYHMNLVVFTITATTYADSANSDNETTITYNDPKYTYSDDVYKTLVQQARAAHLTPVFKLALTRISKQHAGVEIWPGAIGKDSWFNQTNARVVQQEMRWFDNYSDFAAHYAQLAESLNMPFLIFGTELDHMTSDIGTGPGTPGSKQAWHGDTYTCMGRRDCAWRHVIAAMRNTSYLHSDGMAEKGGGYTHKLIYAATARRNDPAYADRVALNTFEWDPASFTWWDAVDIIGIDAFFPLTTQPANTMAAIEQAWQGTSQNAAVPNNGSLVQRLWNLTLQVHRPILFTGAGYESSASSNGRPGSFSGTIDDNGNQQGQIEQSVDMQALAATFAPYPWWLGVVWASDYPIFPRSSMDTKYANTTLFTTLIQDDPIWATNTEWAGDCLAGCSTPAKQGGVWLNGQPYQPLPDDL